MTSPVWVGRNAGTGYSRFSAPISYGLVGWWSWEDLPAVGGLVAAWTNRVAGGVNLTAAGAARPTVIANGTRRAASFDAVANVMQSLFALVQPCGVAIVYRQRVFAAAGNNDVIVDGGAATALLTGNNGPQTTINAGIAVNYAGNVANNVYQAVKATFNGASSILRASGVTLVTGNAGANNPGGLTVGATRAAARFCAIDTMDILVYNRALGTGDVDHNRRYLEEHCGL